jgi:hypothetical protein
MYSYSPIFNKKKEKLITLFMGIFGAVAFGVSSLPFVIFPILFQLLSIVGFGGMIMVGTLCLMRRYTYEITENDGGTLDFIITEYYGRRVTVVCRVALSSVQSVLPLRADTKEQFEALKKGRTVYTYTGVLFDEEQYLVGMEAHGERFFVRICADATLAQALINH